MEWGVGIKRRSGVLKVPNVDHKYSVEWGVGIKSRSGVLKAQNVDHTQWSGV